MRSVTKLCRNFKSLLITEMCFLVSLSPGSIFESISSVQKHTYLPSWLTGQPDRITEFAWKRGIVKIKSIADRAEHFMSVPSVVPSIRSDESRTDGRTKKMKQRAVEMLKTYLDD